MSFVLFVLGLAAAAAGVLMIGFGIPINEFSLGNTLIVAGTTALSCGLIVIGLAIVARQLKKIADILVSRPGGPVSGHSPDVLEEPRGGSRPGASRSALPADFGPSRNMSASSSYDPIEDVPLSPRTQPRIPGIGSPPPADAGAGQRGWRPPSARQAAPPIDPARHEPSVAVPERPQRQAPEAAFDSIWPSDRRAERVDPQPDFTADPGPVAAPRPNGDATHRDIPPARQAADTAPVTVLKSGIVDGMAYTLYTDGSIEAELAQGVVRFGSIEELRNHLEKGV